MEFVFALGRSLAFLGHLIVSGAGIFVGRNLMRVAVPLYKSWRSLKQFLMRTRIKGADHLLAVLTSRLAIQLLFIAAVLGIAVQTIQAREHGGFVDEHPLLSLFITDELEDETEEAIYGPASAPTRRPFHIASVSSALDAPITESTAGVDYLPMIGATIVQPIITDEAAAETGRAGILTYTVEEGDVLATIAEKFNLNLTTILWENKLSSWSIIRPGDQLRILPTDGVAHTVGRGETLESIAQRYGGDAEEILEFNNLIEADDLEAGDLLIIPGGHPPAVAAPPVIRRPAVTRPVLPLPSLPGKLFWPSAAGYRISQYFTWRHHGLDIAIAHGTPVFAAEAGAVVSSGWTRGYGYQITIDHGNGLKTRYAHDSRLLVSRGQSVARGQTIALVGSTGRSTGAHIHFEIFANGVRVNPLQFLR